MVTTRVHCDRFAYTSQNISNSSFGRAGRVGCGLEQERYHHGDEFDVSDDTHAVTRNIARASTI